MIITANYLGVAFAFEQETVRFAVHGLFLALSPEFARAISLAVPIRDANPVGIVRIEIGHQDLEGG